MSEFIGLPTIKTPDKTPVDVWFLFGINHKEMIPINRNAKYCRQTYVIL